MLFYKAGGVPLRCLQLSCIELLIWVFNYITNQLCTAGVGTRKNLSVSIFGMLSKTFILFHNKICEFPHPVSD